MSATLPLSFITTALHRPYMKEGSVSVNFRKRELIQSLFCLILLTIPPLLFLGPILQRGDLPLNLSGMTSRVPWQDIQSSEAVSTENSDSEELIERYYPWLTFLNQAGNKGELPLWNPYEGMGVPFLALWRTRAFSPFSIPLYLFPFATGLGISILAKLLVAGFCAYYMARSFQFTPFFALLAAIPFQLNGFFLVSPWHPISDVLPFFPLLLPCLQRLLFDELKLWPFLSILIGIMTLGGDPESLVAILFFIVILVIIYGIRTYQRDAIGHTLFWVVLSALIGLALAGIQLVPYIEFLHQGRLESKTDGFFKLWDLTHLFVPPILKEGAFASQRALLWFPTGMTAFLLLPLWLSLRSFSNRVRRRRLEALLWTVLFTTLIMALLGSWIRSLVGLSLFDAAHCLIAFPLAMGLLVSTTAEEWIYLSAEKCTFVLKKLTGLLPAFWLAYLVIMIILTRFSPDYQFTFGGVVPILLAAVSVLAVLAITFIWPRPLFTALSLSLLTAGLLWYIYQPQSRVTPESHINPKTMFTDSLDHENNRLAGTEQLQHWPLSPYEVMQIYSPSGIYLNRNSQFLNQSKNHPELLRLAASNQLILTKADIQERFAALRPVLHIKEVLPSGAILVKDLEAHPRSHIVYSVRKGTDDGTPVTLLADGPPVSEGPDLPQKNTDKTITEADIRYSGNNIVEVVAESHSFGVLVLVDSWYPGWKAFVDDVATPVFPVDIAFRGVEISKGNHKLVFEYQPQSLAIGKYVSAAALILLLIGLRRFLPQKHA